MLYAPAGQAAQKVKFEALNEPAGQRVQEDARPPRLYKPALQGKQLAGGLKKDPGGHEAPQVEAPHALYVFKPHVMG